MAKSRGKKKAHGARGGHSLRPPATQVQDHEPTTAPTHDPENVSSAQVKSTPEMVPDTDTAPTAGAPSTPAAPASAANKSGLRHFLLVIDVEGTCDEHARFDFFNEIIELPCVLVDGDSGDVIDEFQTYVRPIEQPTLTEYCTRLTGITQAQVDSAPTFPAALWRLEAWLQTHGVLAGFSFTRASDDEDGLVDAVAALSLGEKVKTAAGPPDGVTVTVVTDGPWDVRDFLRKSLTIHALPRPWYLRRFLDTRKFIHRTFHQSTSLSLDDQLQLCGLYFTGREHCGLDDSRNLARIVAHLVQVEKCVLRANWRLTGTLTHGARIARAVPHGGRCWKSGNEVWEWVDVGRDGKVVRQRPPRPVGGVRMRPVGGEETAWGGKAVVAELDGGVATQDRVAKDGAAEEAADQGSAGPDGREDGASGDGTAARDDLPLVEDGTTVDGDGVGVAIVAEAGAKEVSRELEWTVIKARKSRRAD